MTSSKHELCLSLHKGEISEKEKEKKKKEKRGLFDTIMSVNTPLSHKQIDLHYQSETIDGLRATSKRQFN